MRRWTLDSVIKGRGMNRAISTTQLTKRFGDKTAVDNLSLRVEQGEIYAFLGLNGAGKTTTKTRRAPGLWG